MFFLCVCVRIVRSFVRFSDEWLGVRFMYRWVVCVTNAHGRDVRVTTTTTTTAGVVVVRDK